MKRKPATTKHRRQVSFSGTTPGGVDQINVTFDSTTHGFEIAEVHPTTLKTEIRYERASGKDKVIASVPARENLPAFDLWTQMKEQVTYLVAIDTNTKEVGGRRLSISTACAVPGRLADQRTPIPFDPLCAYAVLDVSPSTNPERIGWHLLIRNHISTARLAAEDRVGVVVDSELGLLPKINSRTHHYYADHILPPNVVMLYGTSDAGGESLLNAMIRYCDKYSRLLFDQVAARIGNLPPLAMGDSNYAGHLVVQFKREAAVDA